MCYEINNTRPILCQKEHIEVMKKMLSLMSIKPILNKIQLFKNLKLEREMYVLDCRTHPLDVHKLFPLVINIILEFFEWLYLNIDPINAKLENVANFNMPTF